MNHYQLEYEFRNLSVREKQELWRQKQLQIFYGNGRPIFNISDETRHIRCHNNPYHHKDVYESETRTLNKSIQTKALKGNDT